MTLAELTEASRLEFAITEDVEGVVITEVDPDSAAAEKRIEPGDVIVEIAQETVTTPEDVSDRDRGAAAGRPPQRAADAGGPHRRAALCDRADGLIRFPGRGSKAAFGPPFSCRRGGGPHSRGSPACIW